MMTNPFLLSDALRPSMAAHTGDLCPSRARPQAAGPPSGRTTSRGPDRAPGFFHALSCQLGRAGHDSREAHPTTTVGSDPRLFVVRPLPTNRSRISTLESHVTALLSPELKNGSTGQSPVPIEAGLSRRLTPEPALLIEDVSKRFIVGRKKKPVDGDLPRVDAPRARRHPGSPRRQRLGQVDAHPAGLRPADPRHGAGRRSSATTSSATRWRSSG